jgi:DNA-binding CsgD family transcriptional regulator
MLRDTLVRLIYESIENPLRRRDFLAAFAEVIDASAVGFLVQDRQLRWAIFSADHGMDCEARESYVNHFVAFNPWSRRRPLAAGEARNTTDLLSDAELRDTEFYRGWLAPYGWFYGSSIILHATETEYATLVAFRPPGRPFRPEELAVYHDLAPHLATAFRLEKRFAELKDTIDRYRHGSPEIETLATLNLSLGETRLALALFKGQTAEEYAQLSGLSISTVRWYARKVYQKAGVRRQTDLIRLLIERFRS